jgi:mono/diheme cytochrome c family protein
MRTRASLLLQMTALSLGLLATAVAPAALARDKSVARGEYLVNLLGCARCHTEGYLLGNGPTGPDLAGSQIGIAYAGADDELRPGLVFAGNLTPDKDTGLGGWTRRDIMRALTTGVGVDGHQRLPVMPWPNYGALSDGDLGAIADYLKSIPPIRRAIPETTTPGDPVLHPYVRFGIFVFTPADQEAEPAAADE